MRRFLAPRTAEALRNTPGNLGYRVSCREVEDTGLYKVRIGTVNTWTGRPYYPLHAVNAYETPAMPYSEARDFYLRKIRDLKAKGFGIARDPLR